MSSAHLISKPSNERFDFPSDLEAETTVDKNLLVATMGFAELPGGVQPDYIMPQNFIDLESGAIEFWTVGLYTRKRSELIFAELPGGTMSLNRDFGTAPIYTDEASATNYAGEVASLPEPDERLLLLASLATLWALRRRVRVASRDP